MPIELVTITKFRCKCIKCGWQWDAEKKPTRCAKCKWLTWNGEDRRADDIYANVPAKYRIARGTKAPHLPRPKELVATLIAAREIVDQIIYDLGPCDHKKKDQCVCKEKGVLADIDRQIERLNAINTVVIAQPVAATA